jgi:FKBP-type peptidyl-prolyl cis-trans isomerase
MPVGSTWMIYIAPELGYGEFAPPAIGPNRALTFKVELLNIKKADEAVPQANTDDE